MGSRKRVPAATPAPPDLSHRDYALAVLCRVFATVRGHRERLANLGYETCAASLDRALRDIYAVIEDEASIL